MLWSRFSESNRGPFSTRPRRRPGATSVPSTCPNPRKLTASHSLTRCPRLARSFSLTRWIRRIKLLPKLTVRVRFPSPAPRTNSVAIHTNWALFAHRDRHPSASEISTRAITRAISHAGRTVSSSGNESYSASAGPAMPAPPRRGTRPRPGGTWRAGRGGRSGRHRAPRRSETGRCVPPFPRGSIGESGGTRSRVSTGSASNSSSPVPSPRYMSRKREGRSIRGLQATRGRRTSPRRRSVVASVPGRGRTAVVAGMFSSIPVGRPWV
jgi:hypothetical protein